MTLPGHMLDYISTRDHRLMRRVHRWRPPRWFRLWMIHRHARGRRLALVRSERVGSGRGRPHTVLSRDCGVDGLQRRGHYLSHPEENNGKEAAERAGAALLGHAAAP